MILKQYYLSCLAHASYLIADETTRVAAVVDPQRDIDQYVQDAERQSLEIRHVFLTHFHADFVAGHLELAQRAGATIHLGARAEAEYAFEPLGDGAEVELGPDVRLRVLETPGHSPESISILVSDRAATVEPAAVLTGDTLFIGDVGRPDLRASIGGRIGFDRVAGFLDGGMDTVGSRTELLCRTARIAAATLAELLTDRPPVVVDVRTEKEWRAERIEGSLNIPLNRLPETWSDVPTGTVVVHCGSGYRSTVAASLLAKSGRTGLFDLVGGLAPWKAASLPVVQGP